MMYLISLLAVGVIITVHEWGHYMAARRVGVGVYEFSIGFGPKLISWKGSETVYSLRAFMLGGYVKIVGLEDDSESAKDRKDSFQHKSIFERFLVFVAGSFMNLVLGFVIFWGILSMVGSAQLSNVLDQVVQGSPAYEAGLQVNDRILAVNQARVRNVEMDLLSVIQTSDGATVTLEVDRDGTVFDVALTPSFNDDSKRYQIGVVLGATWQNYSVLSALPKALAMTGDNIRMTFKTLGMLISGWVSVDDMVGPIGIVQVAAGSLSSSWIGFFHLIAMISIGLGVINLFPFPVLDGGHVLLLGIEGVMGRPLPDTVVKKVFLVGVILLLSLMAYIVLNDVMSWSERQQMLQGVAK